MHISGKRLFVLAAAAVLICTIMTAGCIGNASPLPDEVKIRGNIISVDDQYIPAETIIGMLFNPNDYSKQLFDAVDAYLPPENPVIEIGIGTGALAAYVDNRLERRGDHVGLEPNPKLMPLLKKTKETNGLGTKLSGYAIAYGSETVPLTVSSNLLESTVATKKTDNTIEVPATTIANLMEEYDFQQENNITLIAEAGGVAADIFTNEPEIKSAVKTVIAGEWGISPEARALLIRKANNAGYNLVNETEAGSDGLQAFVFIRTEN
ncbi:MAG TPA: hypothetical protein O0X97_01435 [Methanocorpusculum sp.]|nr:hypothetical protein [Methanocorpusculum sp.]